MTPPNTLQEALAMVRGNPETAAEQPKPFTLEQALTLVRARRPAAEHAPKPATTTAKPAAKLWWEARR